MAKMCPLSGCRSHAGLCGHDKAMVAMMAMVGLAAVGHWVLHLF